MDENNNIDETDENRESIKFVDDVIMDTAPFIEMGGSINYVIKDCGDGFYGQYLSETDTIKINKQSFEDVKKYGIKACLEIAQSIVHEMRHRYQNIEIRKLNFGFPSDKNANQWKENKLKYINPIIGDNINAEHHLQPVEFDANAFAIAFMEIRYGYVSEGNPKIYKESPEFKKAVEDFKTELKQKGLTRRNHNQ